MRLRNFFGGFQIAAAILKGAQDRVITPPAVEGFESVVGKGVGGRVGGRRVALGNRAMMEAEGLGELGGLAARAEELRRDGQTVVFLAADGKAAGLVGVADPIKSTTPDAVRQLHEAGVRVVMLTGDSRTTAEAVGKKLGIDEVVAEGQVVAILEI